MPALRNYHLLISHSWKYNEKYEKVVEWLDDASYFTWSNYSVCCDKPLDTSSDKELKEKLTNRIKNCSAIIVLAGMYANYSKWINYEIDEAIRLGKPIIGVKPWGAERTPTKISENADIMVAWQSSSVVQAVRDYAL